MSKRRKMPKHCQAIVTTDDVLLLDAFSKKAELPESQQALGDKVKGLLDRLHQTIESYEPGMVQTAKELYQRDGETEIDDGAVVSRGEDNGAYVSAWLWVSDND